MTLACWVTIDGFGDSGLSLSVIVFDVVVVAAVSAV